MNTFELDAAYVAHTYSRFPVEIERGRGSLLYGADGKRYIDLGTGIAVNAFGASDPVWQQAVIEQLGKVAHTSNLYYTAPCANLARMLCERTGMKRVFFGNSGAEANECAIKAARKYAWDRNKEDRGIVVTLENSFHGRTLTTLAATGQAHYHELFQPLTPGFVHVPANEFAAMEETVQKERPCAVMMEMIQGEGGVVPLTREFVQKTFELCRRLDVLLIVDEVQTGNGRTGRLYSYMHYGIEPDIVTTAKGLGGGLPIGVCLLGPKVMEVLGPGDHGSTFGGNPVCCAGAISILSRITDGLLQEVEEKGKLIRTALAGKEGILDVSGMGLMVGVKTIRPAGEVIQRCREQGVLVLSAKDRVRLLPALTIPKDLLMEALQILAEACA